MEWQILYVWKPTDCYYNLTAMSLKQAAKKAKILNWQMTAEYDDSISNLFENQC